MADDLVTKGLELFAAGDFAAAAQAWVRARAASPNEPQIEAYLTHLRQLAPDVVAAAERAAPLAVEAATAAPESVPAATLSDLELPGDARAALRPEASAEPEPSPGPALPTPPPPVVAQAPIAVPVPEPPTELGHEPAPEPKAAKPGASKPSRERAAVKAARATPPRARAALGPAAQRQPEAQQGPWAGESALGPPIDVSSSSGGLDLVAAFPTTAPIDLPSAELGRDEAKLRELLELDDFSGALVVAERLLQADPEHDLAKRAQAECSETLEQMYRSKIGDVAAVPRVLIAPQEVIWLDLDHRSGFLLAQVDGVSSFEEIIELSGMETLESLRIVAGLVQKGVIGTS